MMLKVLSKKVEDIIRRLPEKEGQEVSRALEYAKKAHAGQIRKSGEPFICHPLSVSMNLWENYHDINLLIAGLLHDTVEDNEDIVASEVYEKFGKKIGFIVDAMNKRESGFFGKKINFTDRTERLIWAGRKDVRVLLIKLFDRKHNLDTLFELSANKQVRMAFETQAIYYPLQKILKSNSVKEAHNELLNFLEKKNLKTPKKIKEYLYNVSFKDFSHNLYGLVYSNTDKIVWEIDNLEWFEKLASNKDLGDHIEIESMRMESGNIFQALFMFKKGHVFDFSNLGKLRALSIKQ
jgi:(p)ppGpp synthase/HD superfamily hydrolase